MKKLIRSTEQIEAMAIINPMLCNNLTIQVEVEQRNEGPVPHVHVYHDKTRNLRKCSYVRLDKAEYSNHHKHSIPLPKNLKKQFIDVMNSTWESIGVKTPTGWRSSTGYEAAVKTWVETFEHGDYSKFTFDSDGNLVSPDYNQL